MDFKLIFKKLNNTLTEEEELIFQNWYKESSDHRKYFDKVKTQFSDDSLEIDIKEGWKSIEKRIDKPKITNNYWKYMLAASIVLVFGISVFYLLLGKQNNYSKIVKTEKNISTDKVILTLENGSSIVLGEGKYFRSNNLISDGKSIFYKKDSFISQEVIYNYLTIHRGGQFLLQLSDGTKIWLNSDSKIKYPKNFIDGVTRKVELVYGEAYFDVSPSRDHKGSKFKVITKEQEVEVLGTEFNVKAYNDEENIYTTLIKGKVMVKNAYLKKYLKPNQQSVVVLGKKNIEIINVDISDVTAWRRGVFSFNNTSLFEITKVLSRWYDVKFIYKNKDLKNIKYTGVFDRNHSLETVLIMLKTTNDIDYEITNKTIVLK
ncbi:MAG: FecR family protein [Bacteroidales bacterium]|nr:FecR family protein [Bacteroidales bacterium]